MSKSKLCDEFHPHIKKKTTIMQSIDVEKQVGPKLNSTDYINRKSPFILNSRPVVITGIASRML